jgi:NAD(P)-dependent dehydrogenase (short-subunit alcohol dehydrogenase family)
MSENLLDFTGKVVLIIGDSTGIGRAVALAFATLSACCFGKGSFTLRFGEWTSSLRAAGTAIHSEAVVWNASLRSQ